MGAGGSINLNQDEVSTSKQLKMMYLAKTKFDEFDTDKSGLLKNEELIEVTNWVMEQLGTADTDMQAVRNNMIARIDANGDGKLDCAEFLVIFCTVFQRMAVKARARAKFNELEIDRSTFFRNYRNR